MNVHPMRPSLLLFGTEHCHLCEEAEQMLQTYKLPYRHIDIAEDEALLERFGLRIPVLRREEDGTELDWPFSPQDIARFLSR